MVIFPSKNSKIHLKKVCMATKPSKSFLKGWKQTIMSERRNQGYDF